MRNTATHCVLYLPPQFGRFHYGRSVAYVVVVVVVVPVLLAPKAEAAKKGIVCVARSKPRQHAAASSAHFISQFISTRLKNGNVVIQILLHSFLPSFLPSFRANEATNEPQPLVLGSSYRCHRSVTRICVRSAPLARLPQSHVGCVAASFERSTVAGRLGPHGAPCLR
jgi:hypothetical protein